MTRIRVLLVDDEIKLCNLMKGNLEKIYDNYSIKTAYSGKEAIEIMKKEEFDVLVTDMKMPEMNGIELMEWSQLLSPDTQIIVLTGHGDLNNAVLAMQKGAINYLRKPVSIEVFHFAIQQAYDKRRIKMKLIESEERFRSLFENSKDAIYITDKHGKVTYINSFAVNMLGYSSAEDVIGTEIWNNHVSQEELYGFIEEHSKSSGSVKDYRMNIKTLQNETRECLITSTVRTNNRGEPIEYTGIIRDMTEYNQAIHNLEISEKKYRTIFEHKGVATIIFRDDLTVSLVNKLFEKLSGYTKSEIENVMKITDFVEEEETKGFLSSISKEHKELPTFEIVLSDKSGNDKHTLCSITLKPDSQSFVATFLDVTDIKNLQSELKKSEERFRTYVENANDLFYSVSKDGELTYVSPNWTDLLGHKPEDVIGKSIAEYVHPEDIQTCFDFLEAIMKTGKPRKGIEYRVKHQSGNYRWHTTSGAAVKDKDGNTLYYVGVAHDITHRKEADRLLKQNLYFLQILIDTMPNPVFYKDLEGKYLGYNSAFEEMLGFDELKAVGKGVYELFPSEIAKKYNEMDQLLLDNPGKQIYETEIIDNTGEKRSIILYKSTFDDIDGNISGIVGTIVDITRRKKMEEELKATLSELNAIINNTAVGIAHVKETQVVWVNRKFEELTSLSQDKIKGRKVTDFNFKRRNSLELAKDIQNCFARKENYFYEDEALIPGKDNFWVSLSGQLIDIDRPDKGSIWIVEDITERKLAEKSLRESEELYRTLVNHFPNGTVSIFDQDFRCLLTGGSELSRLHVSSENIIGKKLQYTFDKKIINVIEPKFRLALENQSTKFEISFEEQKYLVLVVPITDEHNNVSLILSLMQNITEQKQFEDKLKRATDDIRDFLYIVSHDLKAPLTNMKGFTKELSFSINNIKDYCKTSFNIENSKEKEEIENILFEDIPEAFDYINSSAKQIDKFLNSLLSLSRLGQRELIFEEINTKALIEDILKNFAHQIESKNIEISIGKLPSVIADRLSVEQIFSNIISNAIKYNDKSSGKIQIEGYRNSHETVFNISDNGRGIEEKDIDKIFHPFRRAGKSNSEGEGMGLAFVSTLIRRHLGRISCESEINKGSTFKFTISNKLSTD